MSERSAATALLAEIEASAANLKEPIRLMEVCGTHTVTIFRAGIRQMLPKNIRLVSGPGCPVCVTPEEYIDKAMEYAERGYIIATFGDMLKVPGSSGSLAAVRAKGADIRIIYSPLDSLQVAKDNPLRRVIFLAVGFETTTPTTAATLAAARADGRDNLYFLAAPKLVPPALVMLLSDPKVQVDGFLLPGHVAMVTGAAAFGFLPRDYGMPAVVTGFEPIAVLRSVLELVRQKTTKKAALVNEYPEAVTEGGNPAAQKMTDTVYEPCDATWRGIGVIKNSGLKIRDAFAAYDIERVAPVETKSRAGRSACRCGEVLRGIIDPPQCLLFGQGCVPEHAVGPCMVSVEGVCAAWYKYGRDNVMK